MVCFMIVIDKKGYRLNVGIVLANATGQVFWGKRIGSADDWQFPQGGVHPYETLEETMYRELTEEIGLEANDVEILHVSKRWLRYELPQSKHHSKVYDNPCIGQRQKWFLLRLISHENNICLNCAPKPEFDGWRWVDYWHPLKQVIYFKREIYHNVLREFEPIVKL